MNIFNDSQLDTLQRNTIEVIHGGLSSRYHDQISLKRDIIENLNTLKLISEVNYEQIADGLDTATLAELPFLFLLNPSYSFTSVMLGKLNLSTGESLNHSSLQIGSIGLVGGLVRNGVVTGGFVEDDLVLALDCMIGQKEAGLNYDPYGIL